MQNYLGNFQNLENEVMPCLKTWKSSPVFDEREIGIRCGSCDCHKFSLPRCINDSIMHWQKNFVLLLVSEVIKLFVTIVCQISKFKVKYARGVRHSVTGSVGWMLREHLCLQTGRQSILWYTCYKIQDKKTYRFPRRCCKNGGIPT